MMASSLPCNRFLRVLLVLLAFVATSWILAVPAGTRDRVAASVEPARPPMFVLQVGIGKYQHTPTWAELRGAVTDVVEMRKVLEGERWGIPVANIVTLTDAQGTKQLIFENFQTHLIAKAREHYEKTKNRDAVVMFQFSGHGSQAPDVDGDEKDDGKDETLVTVDSQDAPGKNFDISDDEIYALTTELRRWTDNIVYIFDSCHSGSGTRNAEDVRRLPEKKSPVVPMAGVGTTTRSGTTKKEDGDSGVLPPGDDYIVITAARPNELASQKNCFEECGDARRPVVYGNLTYYLIDELKNARNDTSYRELMENVTRRVVAEKPTQTPQLEGDSSRFVFGSLGRTEDNFVRIASGETKAANGTRSLKIRAGAMQGVTVGTVVAFYAREATRFEQVQKISSGIVTAVTPAESTVMLLGPKREIAIGDKSVVVTPDLGSLRLKVDLEVDSAKLSADDKKTVALVRSYLTPSLPNTKGEVELVSTRAGQPTRWDVALLKDKFSNVSSKIAGGATAGFACEVPGEDRPDGGVAAKPDRDVFYLAGRDFVPLYRFCMESPAADEQTQTAAARRLEEALVHLSSLRTVGSISNKRSALTGKVVVTPIRLKGDIACVMSTLKIGSPERSIADLKSGTHQFDPREPFWFEVANNSTKPLYVALLNLGPDGAVSVFAPRGKTMSEAGGVVIPAGGKRIVPGDDCRSENGELVEAGALRASRTPGLDRFKFIVSTARLTYEDFSYLEQPSLTKRNSKGSLSGINDWTTVETIFQVIDTGY